jgi:hypothetical protein
MVPLIGAREATVMGGAIITIITLFTAWWTPALTKFRWDMMGERSEGGNPDEEKLVAR